MKQKSSQMRFAPWPVVQAALALALSGLLLARPQAAAQGFAAGLKLCGGSLLPALFPLFVVCGLLGPLAPALGWPLRPLMRLCGIRSPRAPAVLVLGWCGGYAVCAQQIAALRKTGELPPRDAALLLLLGCCSGPGFVVGCIGGQLFGSVALGLLLYGLQLATNLAAAACLVPFLPKQELPAGQGSSQQKSVTFPQAISNAVQSSLTVCGCAVFCRVVGSVLGQGMPDGARPYLNAALEISAGCADFAAAGSVAGVCLCLSLLGASVLAQLAALLQGTVPLGLLLAARVLHFVFLQGLLHLCLPLVPGQAAVFTSLAPQVVVMKRTAWDTALAIAFFLCAALYQLYKTCQSSYIILFRQRTAAVQTARGEPLPNLAVLEESGCSKSRPMAQKSLRRVLTAPTALRRLTRKWFCAKTGAWFRPILPAASSGMTRCCACRTGRNCRIMTPKISAWRTDISCPI